MPTFKKEVFISYAHIDNKPLTPEQQGWVTRFHASLEAILSMRMGGESLIWRDNKLQGNDVFADEIVEQFSETAVLVSVLTPRYLNSEWCTREVAEFCEEAKETGGIVIENKARVFKVLKAPVDTQESLPKVVKDILGYEFFTIVDGAPQELDSAFGEEFGHDYNRKVNKLAWEISVLLKALRADPGPKEHNEATADKHDDKTTKKAVVYLAECSYDRKQIREILEGELKRTGNSVLPDRELPRDEEGYVAAVEGLLKRCELAIHLVGEMPGVVPDGSSQKSVVVLQNELAAKLSKSDGLKRVIWVPLGTQSKQVTQQAFIDALHNDAEAQVGADLITGEIEDLKSSIRSILTKLETPEPQSPAKQDAAGSGAKLIYLICDNTDRQNKSTLPVRKFLKSRGFEVEVPTFEGNATEVREAHEQLLTTADAVILFYGAGSEGWKKTIDNDLKKAPSYRGGRPLLASYTYLTDPRTIDKDEMIELREPDVIVGFGEFSEAVMQPFMRALSPDEIR